jgi:hypothetical protein
MLVLGLGGLGVGPASPALAGPIPATPTAAPGFEGRGATVQPVAAPAIPQHPFMARNERSNLHDDAYQTDSYRRSGPLGRDVRTTSGEHRGLCGSVTFDARGRIVTVCVGPTQVTLHLLHPRTLDSLASLPLPSRVPGTGGFSNPFQNFTGGGYFYLDDRDRAVIPTSDRRVLVVGETDDAPGFRVARTIDLTAAVPQGDAVISVLPDWDGRLWFASRNGVVGTVAKDGDTVRKLVTGERIGNSFAIGEEGVYIVTDAAMYRFEAGAAGAPQVVWREPYPNDGTQKPGQSQRGSGTTPTLMGPDLVAITDNADPVQVIAYRRARAVDGPREVCRAAVFSRGSSSTDQSLVTDGSALIVENNYGYEGPQSVLAGATTTAGLARVDVDRAAGKCSVAWTSQEVAPSVVPKLALGSGLLYTYTKAGGDASDPWYLTALDHRTGATVFRALAGSGALFNNNYAPVTIGPDSTAYVGVLGGLVALRDAEPRDVAPAPDRDVVPAGKPVRAAARRARVTVDCGRRRTLVVRTADARARLLGVRRGRRVARDGRAPLRVRVRRGGPMRVEVRLADGTRQVRTVTRRCR